MELFRFLNEFEPIERIGFGSFGCVFKAKNKFDKIEYAVKRIPVIGK